MVGTLFGKGVIKQSAGRAYCQLIECFEARAPSVGEGEVRAVRALGLKGLRADFYPPPPPPLMHKHRRGVRRAVMCHKMGACTKGVWVRVRVRADPNPNPNPNLMLGPPPRRESLNFYDSLVSHNTV